MADKFSAVWVSHSSISDYLNCPKAYFLNNVYRDPETGHKITLMQPPLALGQAVHEVLESLSVLPVDRRFEIPLVQRFEQSWEKISGMRGGFLSDSVERAYKERGYTMMSRVQKIKGPLARKAVKIKAELPFYWLSEADNIILCGKIDWLEYLPEKDAVVIVDFKTGKGKESAGSLQLPIYRLLLEHCQKREVAGAHYWYLETDDELTPKELPNIEEASKKVLEIAKKIKLARQLHKFDCPKGDECFACRNLQQIVNGNAQKVGVNEYNQDVYILKSDSNREDEMESEIL